MARKAAAPVARPAAKADLFKTKDIKEDVLINRVISQAGVANDAETTGFIKAVLPRFAESSPRQAFSSMSKMVKEFGRGNTASRANAGGASNGSNGSDGERTAAAAPAERRRPGRPKGSRNKANPGGGSSNDKGQASERKPGRPKGSRNKADRPQ